MIKRCSNKNTETPKGLSGQFSEFREMRKTLTIENAHNETENANEV